MSFSRAPLKRFNENIPCGPAPGSYDVKDEAHKGPASFRKAERFKTAKPACASAMPPPSPSKNVPMSPVRRTMSADGLVDASSVKTKPAAVMELKRHNLLEKEIRCLVQQRGEQDRRLLGLEEELRRQEAKLLSAVRERTGLSASAATLDRQLAELKKANEFLKNKVSADKTKKRINSLTMELMEARNDLDLKNKEISVLQINTGSQVKLLETDLQATKATVKMLTDRNKDLEDLQQETKTQNEELSTEAEKLHAVIRELEAEIKVLQGYLDTANDQVQELRLKIRESQHAASESQRNATGQLERDLLLSQEALREQEESSKRRQEELLACRQALGDTERRLASRESELSASREKLSDVDRRVQRAGEEADECRGVARQQEAELARLREVLRSTEQELDERMAHLASRCLSYEEERSKLQEEGMRKVEELNAELTALRELKREERAQELQQQQEQHAALGEELEKEKTLAVSLSALLEHERAESEEQRAQMKEELEEVLGELAVMEEQERRRQGETEQSLQRLQRENRDLELQLSTAGAALDRSTAAALLEEGHLTAVSKLREEQAAALSALGDVTAELESTKRALAGAEERLEAAEEQRHAARRLTEELARVTMTATQQQQEEETERLKQSLEEQRESLLLAARRDEERAREEHARVLLEVERRLVQKEEEMCAAEGSHAALLAQLQEEVLVQRQEKEQALTRLEEQTQAREERDQAAAAALRRAEDETAEMQAALRELRESAEADRSEGLRRGEELLGLRARLQTLEEQEQEEEQEERSAVRSLEADASVLRERLAAAERDGERLRAGAEEEAAAARQALEAERRGGQALRERAEVLAQEKVTLQWEMAEQSQELRRQLAEAQEKSSLSSDGERWKKQYEELYFKVKPFQEQLNSFAAERDALQSENGVNQDELNRLADAYARLLGHQNQKQKIKHVIKLKDENITLKQEVSKLRAQVSRQKSDLEHLGSAQPGARQHRFDPSKAFQHAGGGGGSSSSKENWQPGTPAPGLREGKYNL